MAEDKLIPKATPGVRLIVLGTIVFAVLFVAYRVTYTNIPPQRLAVAEMLTLADPVRVTIAETFQDHGTLEGHIEGLTPAAQSSEVNTKGPFEWVVGLDGSIRGQSVRYKLSIEYTTPDEGKTWACRVTPAEYSPSVGVCARRR